MRFKTFWWGCQILAETEKEGEILRQFYEAMPKTAEPIEGMLPEDAGVIRMLYEGGMDGEFTQSEIDTAAFAVSIYRGDY